MSDRRGPWRRLVVLAPVGVVVLLLALLVRTGVLTWPGLVAVLLVPLIARPLIWLVRIHRADQYEGRVPSAARRVGTTSQRRWEHGYLIPAGDRLVFHARGMGAALGAARFELSTPVTASHDTRAVTWGEGWSIGYDLRIVALNAVDGGVVEVAARPQDLRRLAGEDAD